MGFSAFGFSHAVAGGVKAMGYVQPTPFNFGRFDGHEWAGCDRKARKPVPGKPLRSLFRFCRGFSIARTKLARWFWNRLANLQPGSRRRFADLARFTNIA